MFTASYPASLLREENGKGFHVRFPDLPEALTGGDDLEDTLVQAADCLAEAIAGRIARGDEIPQPSKAKRGQHLIGVPLYLAPKLALYLAMRERCIPQHRVRQAPGRERNGSPAHVEPEARYQTRKDSGCAGCARQAHCSDIRRCRVIVPPAPLTSGTLESFPDRPLKSDWRCSPPWRDRSRDRIAVSI